MSLGLTKTHHQWMHCIFYLEGRTLWTFSIVGIWGLRTGMKLFLKDTERSSMTQGKKTPDIGILSCKEDNKHTVMSWPTKECWGFPWSQDRRCNHKTGITPVCFGGSQEKVLQLKVVLKNLIISTNDSTIHD